MRLCEDVSVGRAGVLKTLADPSNYVVSKAAELYADLGIRELAPELIRAFDRSMLDAAKTDLQCRGKTAIVKALVELV